MLDNTVQNINGNENIVAGGDINLTQVVNNEIHINLYEYDIVNLIELFDKNMDLFEDDNSYMVVEAGKYDYVEKEKKNKLNNLSADYFEILKEDFLPYFYKIDSFLKNPMNKSFQTKYKKVSLRLRITIEANRSKYNGFEEVISDIANTLSKAADKNVELDPFVITVFLNYMYWSCDIGRKK